MPAPMMTESTFISFLVLIGDDLFYPRHPRSINPYTNMKNDLSADCLRARDYAGLSRGASTEQSIPINSPGKLHYDKERENAKNRDRKPREPLEEERVGKQHQINKLQDARFNEREAIAHGQPQVRYDQPDRDQRTDQKRDVNRYVVNQISQ